MGAVVGVVADDLTGAADAGAGFAQRGHSTMVVWPLPPIQPALFPNTSVLAVDAGTRALDGGGAADRTDAIVRAMREAGIRLLYKKADSLLRGHLAAEVHAALRAWHPGSIALVAPAFPATGRTTVEGRQHVDGRPLEGPSLTALLEGHGLRPVHASLDRVRRGLLPEFRQHLSAGSAAMLVCDAETDQDLRSIVAAFAPLGHRAVWVGSGGLAPVLADTLGVAVGGCYPSFVGSGPILVVAGSNSPLAREQVAYTQAAGTPHIGIPIEALDGTNDAAGPICTSAVAACLRSGSDVLVTVTGSVGAGGSNDSAVTRRLGTLLQPCAGLATGLVLTGGDTAAGVLRAWGAEGLRLIGELQPGIAFGVTVGAGSLGVITKPGAFGGPSCLTDACAALRAGMAHGAGGVT